MTSRRAPLLIVDDADPDVPVVVVDEDPDDIAECSLPLVLPVTWIVWPRWRSRSLPPSSFHDIAAPCPDGSAAVEPTLLVPDVPVVPAVVVVGFDEPLPVADDEPPVVVADPPVVVAPERALLAESSMRALFNMNVPSLPRARHPVTVISCDASLCDALR